MTVRESAEKQAIGLGLGTAMGTLTGQSNPGKISPNLPKTAIQVGQATGAALRNGSGISGAATAGAAVLTAKAAAIGTATAVAAPIVVGAAAAGALGYIAYKLLSDDE